MKLITHKNKVYRSCSAGPINGFVEMALPDVAPTIQYTGPKIPILLWQQITSWFTKHKANEVQVRLYTDFTSWRAVPFPQSYPSGMTIKEIADHPDTAALHASLAGWTHYGSVHHHCSASAFQSSTDLADEKSVAGLHLTVGHMDKATFDLHSRVCVIAFGVLSEQGEVISPATQGFYEPVLSEWIELPPEAAALPKGLHESVVKFYLTQAVCVGYPPEWDAALIKPAPFVSNFGNGRHNGGLHDHTSSGYNREWNKHEWNKHVALSSPTLWKTGPQAVYASTPTHTIEDELKLTEDQVIEGVFAGLEELADEQKITLSELCRLWLSNPHDPIAGEIDYLIEKFGWSASDFVDAVRTYGLLEETTPIPTQGLYE